MGKGGARTPDGARSPLLGVVGADLDGVVVERLPVLFRVLVTGKAGSAMLGGPFEGREGRGRAVAIVARAGAEDVIDGAAEEDTGRDSEGLRVENCRVHEHTSSTKTLTGGEVSGQRTRCARMCPVRRPAKDTQSHTMSTGEGTVRARRWSSNGPDCRRAFSANLADKQRAASRPTRQPQARQTKQACWRCLC